MSPNKKLQSPKRKYMTQALRELKCELFGSEEITPALIGRPPVPLADNFNDQMALLDIPQQAFVRHVLAGKSYLQSYQLAYPDDATNVRKKSWMIVKERGVANALKLGKAQGALQQIAGLSFDTKACFEEFGKVLQQAKTESQLSAAVNAIIGQAKLFKLIDSRDNVQTAQSITFVFKRYGDQPEVVNGIEGKQTNPFDDADEVPHVA
jgi:hypothetical protein